MVQPAPSSNLPRARRGVRRAASGFTLVEVLLAAAIAGLLAVGLAYVFRGSLVLSNAVREGSSLEMDARFAVTLLRRDVSEAARVVAATPTSLDLRTAGGDLVAYWWEGAASDPLLRQINGGDTTVVAADVDSVGFALQTVSRPWVCEKMMPAATEGLMRNFDPGDWDAWIASTHCDYESRGQRRLEDDHWAAVDFWSLAAGYEAFSRVEVRMRAIDHQPPEVDTIVSIYQKHPTYDRPGLLIASGTINRNDVPTADYDWCSADLITVTEVEPDPSGSYWLVVRPASLGGHTYAGHLEYERIEHCWSGEWPTSGASYRETDDGGSHWSAAVSDEEGFHRVYGITTELKLTEVAGTVTDTLGVTYSIDLQQGGNTEHHAGFIALLDL